MALRATFDNDLSRPDLGIYQEDEAESRRPGRAGRVEG
jgi:hypothetical protein